MRTLTSILAVLIVLAPATLRAAPDKPSPGHAAAAAPAGWQATVQQDIAAREYEVTWQTQAPADDLAPAWQAPNRAHGFRTYFGDAGVKVIPRTQDKPSWIWGLALAGYGRGTSAWSLPRASLAPSGKRIEYRRGEFLEWYDNGPLGLEQGFVLASSPEDGARRGRLEKLHGRLDPPGRSRGTAGEGLLHLDLALSGGLMPILSADGQSIDFAIPGGERVLRYSGLAVKDATG